MKVVLYMKLFVRTVIQKEERDVLMFSIGGAKGRTNAIGALLQGVLITVCLFQANINADIFHGWIIQDLLPKVPTGSVIVMDNASFHKRDEIRLSIEQAGCILEFLPPYSPDLNPIERQWAKLKSIRAKHRCSVEEIFTF